MEEKDNVSQAGSKTSRSSRSSSTSASQVSRATIARARAEAARARASYAEREVQLKLSKVKVEAELESLTLMKEAAAADAEADILEAAEENNGQLPVKKKGDTPLDIDPVERTHEYVKDQTRLRADPLDKAAVTNMPCPDDSFHTLGTPYMHQTYEPAERKEKGQSDYHKTPSKPSLYPTSMRADHKTGSPARQGFLNPAAKPYSPSHAPNSPNQDQEHPMMDFAKYLARRELVNTGLNKFDDRPESFRAWRSSFVNATGGLGLSAGEELDLLMKWLGKESAEHVKRMRQVHVNEPEAALRKAWDRLYECYAAPEVIENALFKKLDAFPRVASKDC